MKIKYLGNLALTADVYYGLIIYFVLQFTGLTAIALGVWGFSLPDTHVVLQSAGMVCGLLTASAPLTAVLVSINAREVRWALEDQAKQEVAI